MNSKFKQTLLAASIMSAIATQAHADFKYDLRFAPSQVVAGGQFVDAHNVNISAPGIYTLQLWGQITGDTNPANDGWGTSFVNALLSTQGSGGALLSGGLTSNGTALGTHVQSPAASPIVGIGGTDINGDSVADWGSTSSSSSAKNNWLKWSGGANPGYLGGSPDAQSQAVNANTWEVLIATFTVDASGIGNSGATTTFTPFETAQVRLSGTSTVNATIVYNDSLTTATNVVSANNSVVFTVLEVPEPASLGVLALGAIGLLARRRR